MSDISKVSRKTQFQSGGLNEVQLKFMRHVINKLIQLPISRSFLDEVDDREVPEYKKKIQKPIWLRKILMKIDQREYITFDQWRTDVHLIWRNARKFNGEEHWLTRMAAEIRDRFEEWAKIIPSTEAEEWAHKIRKHHERYRKLMDQKPCGKEI